MAPKRDLSPAGLSYNRCRPERALRVLRECAGSNRIALKGEDVIDAMLPGLDATADATLMLF